MTGRAQTTERGDMQSAPGDVIDYETTTCNFCGFWRRESHGPRQGVSFSARPRIDQDEDDDLTASCDREARDDDPASDGGGDRRRYGWWRQPDEALAIRGYNKKSKFQNLRLRTVSNGK